MGYYPPGEDFVAVGLPPIQVPALEHEVVRFDALSDLFGSDFRTESIFLLGGDAGEIFSNARILRHRFRGSLIYLWLREVDSSDISSALNTGANGVFKLPVNWVEVVRLIQDSKGEYFIHPKLADITAHSEVEKKLRLSSQEGSVLSLLLGGKFYKEIAGSLGISESMVKKEAHAI